MFINKLSGSIKNKIGFTTNRKLIILESDDWGSNRMPSEEVFELLKEKGLTNDNIRYDRYDTLASATDLAEMFEVLHSVKDRNGRPAAVTPVSVLANPDFKKIEESGFKQYHYELFTDSLRKRREENAINLWNEGIQGGFFVPQYHGREHLNVAKWMKALQNGHEATHIAFQHGVYGITLTDNNSEDSYLAAYDYFEPSEIEQLKEITSDGLNQFEKVFGFRSTYFVPPNGPLSSMLNPLLSEKGIKGIQTARFIYSESIGKGQIKKRIRYFGMKTKYNQVYTLRNAFFEPSEPTSFSWVDKCLADIEFAFKYKKPAVISSHRVNFIGSIHPENRDRGLAQLKELLKLIVKKWPDVEFITSGELISLMIK